MQEINEKMTEMPYFDAQGNRLFLTPELLDRYLDSIDCVVKYNQITKQLDVSGMEDENQESLEANLPAILFARLQGQFRGVTMQSVQSYLDILATRYAYNPVLGLLGFYRWDGVDRLPELHRILGLKEDDDLSRTLLHKWLLQCLALQYNTPDRPFGADGVLVLTGPQGIGKTSFFRKLAMLPCFFKEGAAIDFRDKDSYIRATACWICELGELESTLRRDVEKLKAFLTQPIDEYRLPYARANSRHVRRTSFCGTCNSEEFLIDTTGNRRFWSIPVENIDLGALRDFSPAKLWLQIREELTQSDGRLDLTAFRLTREEQKQLAARNIRHEKKLSAQDEIEDILSETDTPFYKVVREYMTVSEFKFKHMDELRSYSVNQIGKALDKLGVQATVQRVGQTTKRMRLLPKREYYSRH